jgi:hypothetical protein
MYLEWEEDESTIDLNHEECIVTYIDILGFTKFVKSSASDATARIGILQALTKFSQEMDSHSIVTVEGEEDTQPSKKSDVRNFSDSVLRFRSLSDEPNIGHAIFHEVVDICFAQATLLEHGVLLRGGMTIGKLSFNCKHVYGPALLKAVDLEKRVAIYPRIVADDKIHQHFSDGANHGEPFIDTDFDGTPFLNYLVSDIFCPFNDLNNSQIHHVSEAIKTHIAALVGAGCNAVSAERQKLLWLAHRYDKMLGNLMSKHPHETEHLKDFFIAPDLSSKKI